MSEPSQPHLSGVYDWSWYRRGATNIVSLPAIILISAFIGFGGVAREAGMTLAQTVFMIPLIWALPSHLIVVAGIASGAPFLAIAAAVALASIRMMPMTMALVPEIRAPHSKTWHMVVVSNFVAITAWVHTLSKASEIPREGRLPYFAGFANTMMLATTCAAGIVHQLAGGLPPLLMAMLYFLTPIYFAATTWNTARVKAEYLALALGFALGPVFFFVTPQANILIAGTIGGLCAFGFHLLAARRADY